jgi:hypothetical protein
MKRLVLIILVLLPQILLSQSLPKWVKKPPTSSEMYYAVGMGSSGNEDVAERKARLDANVNLAKQVEHEIVTVTTRIETMIRGNKVLKERVRVIRKKVMATLTDTRVEGKHSVNERNGSVKVYMLISMPKSNINQSVINQVENDKELYATLSKSKAYIKFVNETMPSK